jgi:hypothetical protein
LTRAAGRAIAVCSLATAGSALAWNYTALLLCRMRVGVELPRSLANSGYVSWR